MLGKLLCARLRLLVLLLEGLNVLLLRLDLRQRLVQALLGFLRLLQCGAQFPAGGLQLLPQGGNVGRLSHLHGANHVAVFHEGAGHNAHPHLADGGVFLGPGPHFKGQCPQGQVERPRLLGNNSEGEPGSEVETVAGASVRIDGRGAQVHGMARGDRHGGGIAARGELEVP